MSVEVPDANLTALWRIGAWQLIKNCPRIHRDDIRKVGAAGDVGPDCRRVADPADPDGAYVRRWVPELARVPDKYIQAPWTMPAEAQRLAGTVIGTNYPAPIVDHALARERTLAAYKTG